MSHLLTILLYCYNAIAWPDTRCPGKPSGLDAAHHHVPFDLRRLHPKIHWAMALSQAQLTVHYHQHNDCGCDEPAPKRNRANPRVRHQHLYEPCVEHGGVE